MYKNKRLKKTIYSSKINLYEKEITNKAAPKERSLDQNRYVIQNLIFGVLF